MSPTNIPHVAALYRYPIKGMTPERLDATTLLAGEAMPGDRIWAIENGGGRFDPSQPRDLPKINFVMLLRDERLATLEARYDHDAQTLTILRAGRQVARGNLATGIGRQMIEQFLAAYMKGSLRGAPKICGALGHTFQDSGTKAIHVVNLASVRDLERVMGRPLDPLRFRANVLVDGLAPWAENGWLDEEIALGEAGVRLAVFDRTRRCEATNVDPVTGVRDTAIPAVLSRTWGHSDFGVYAKVVTGGALALGDAVALA